MIVWSIALFGAAALGGIGLVALRLRDPEGVPLGLAVGHGLLAATALILLAIPVVQGAAAGLATWALVAFVVAALGGFYLFATHLRSGSFGLPPAVVHAVVAVVGFVLLVLFYLG